MCIRDRYVDFIKDHTNIKVIYYGHDLHFLRLGREYELTGDIKIKREADYWRAIELSMMQKAEVSYYPSYIEEQAIHKINPEIPVKAITAYVYDKFLDKIEAVSYTHLSDAVLDALMEQDPMSRVACETAVTTGLVLVMGEITTNEMCIRDRL